MNPNTPEQGRYPRNTITIEKLLHDLVPRHLWKHIKSWNPLSNFLVLCKDGDLPKHCNGPIGNVLSAWECNKQPFRELAVNNACCILESSDANMKAADEFCDACGREIPIYQLEFAEEENLVGYILEEETYSVDFARHPTMDYDDEDK